MITVETWATCEYEGCGWRERMADAQPSVWPHQSRDVAAAAAHHPATWPSMTDASGERYFCSHVCLGQTAHGAIIGMTPPRLRLGITQHEVTLLGEVAGGWSNGEIGTHLGVRANTVKNSLTRLFLILRATGRIELVLNAHALGIINLNTSAATCAKRLGAIA